MHYSKPVLLFATAFVLGATSPTLGQVINEDLKLLASDGLDNDEFGHSIAVDNGIIAVGMNKDTNDNGFKSGSAYLFDAATGLELFKLLPSDGAANDAFGWSIAIHNGIVAVSSYRDDDNGTDSGSAYLFDATTGAELFKLLPSDGAANDAFGRSIAIHNGIVAVGAVQDDDHGLSSGSAYLFDASTGAQLFKLVPSDGASTDFFGQSIAIADGVVVVGANQDDDNGSDSGSAYLFDASTGEQIDKLIASDGASGDNFGWSIAISNGVVAVGAFKDVDNGSNSGSAYLFDVSTGAQFMKLLPNDGVQDDWFGFSIGTSNGVVVVGAIGDDDNGSASGSAYQFDASSGAQIAKLLPSDGVAFDDFGRFIAIGNGVVAVGAMWDDDNGGNSGSVYVFNVGGGPVECLADTNLDGAVNVTDLLALLAAWGPCPPPCLPDNNADGDVNVTDLLALLAAWGACP